MRFSNIVSVIRSTCFQCSRHNAIRSVINIGKVKSFSRSVDIENLTTHGSEHKFCHNTIFNILDEDGQQRCFDAVAARLRTGAAFVVEAFVPDADRPPTSTSDVSVRSLAADHVVLSVSVDDPAHQRAEGQFVQFTESGGVRLRPWSIRWSTPEQLDAMAARAGLVLRDRATDMAGTPFTPDSEQHVSVYEKPEALDGQ